jgi:hypothetical protein
MKVLLGCLMCLVLTIAQSSAISGGPWSGAGHVTVTGTYAGLLIPRPLTPPVSENSLGLFTAIVPQTGLATGVVGIFRGGYFYPGTIQAVGDPDTARITGIVNATFDITFSQEIDPVTHTTRNLVVTFNANGSLDGKVFTNASNPSTTTARLKGDAEITYKQVGGITDPSANAGPISYKIRGFKQSEATS